MSLRVVLGLGLGLGLGGTAEPRPADGGAPVPPHRPTMIHVKIMHASTRGNKGSHTSFIQVGLGLGLELETKRE